MNKLSKQKRPFWKGFAVYESIVNAKKSCLLVRKMAGNP